jgi:hypothetical protein
MTEDEAKAKWCPAFRGNDHGVNRPLDLDTNAMMGRCIGSACMAWRWIEDAEFRARADRAFDRDGTRLMPDRGYCGLAGAPQ